MIFLVGVSQAKRTNLELAELNQASEDQKVRFFKASFRLHDSNQDGFVTSNEFDNADFGTLPFNSLIKETMTEALIQFEQEHENGIEPNKIGITFEDYKDALKRKLEQIVSQAKQLEQIVSQAKLTNLEMAELNQASEDQKIELNQATEDQKIRFFKASFKLYDANKDGFVTSDEFDNTDFGTLPFNYLIRETMTEALIQFEQEHENGIEPTKIGITFEDYKDALKRKLERIYGKKSE
jgi:Ca2+-binding EF-hand superfamily protein